MRFSRQAMCCSLLVCLARCGSPDPVVIADDVPAIPFELRIEPVKAAVSCGEELALEVTLRNVSDDAFTVPAETLCWSCDRFERWEVDGRSAMHGTPKACREHMIGDKPPDVLLKPGGSIVKRIPLYDNEYRQFCFADGEKIFDKAGRHSVNLKIPRLPLVGTDECVSLASNTVSVEVHSSPAE